MCANREVHSGEVRGLEDLNRTQYGGGRIYLWTSAMLAKSHPSRMAKRRRTHL